MQEEQARYKYRVVWNAQKGSYEVHAIRPRIFSWLAITPDSARWFELLQQSPSFHFHGQHGRFTARKEKRARGGVYWIAYRHMQGKLRKKYIGPTASVTIARLEEIAGDLERLTIPEADA
jgi:LuxR family maltose regulon positive regulatory protein